jgi:hypothetical protein
LENGQIIASNGTIIEKMPMKSILRAYWQKKKLPHDLLLLVPPYRISLRRLKLLFQKIRLQTIW